MEDTYKHIKTKLEACLSQLIFLIIKSIKWVQKRAHTEKIVSGLNLLPVLILNKNSLCLVSVGL